MRIFSLRTRRAARVIAVTVFAAAFFAFIPYKHDLYSFAAAQGSKIYIYAGGITGDLENCRIREIRPYLEIETDADNYKRVLRCAEGVMYVTIEYKGSPDAALRYLNIKNKTVYGINGGELITGYSDSVSGRTLSGVNVQVYQKDGKVIIGCPTIYGGY